MLDIKCQINYARISSQVFKFYYSNNSFLFDIIVKPRRWMVLLLFSFIIYFKLNFSRDAIFICDGFMQHITTQSSSSEQFNFVSHNLFAIIVTGNLILRKRKQIIQTTRMRRIIKMFCMIFNTQFANSNGCFSNFKEHSNTMAQYTFINIITRMHNIYH